MITDIVVDGSRSIGPWMTEHGARWQPALRGTLGLTRTNRFFLVVARRSSTPTTGPSPLTGVTVRYDTGLVDLEVDGDRCRAVVVEAGGQRERLEADAVVLAAGGFEANVDWLAKRWGPAAYNFAIRGTPFNDGAVLDRIFALGATTVADPTRFHAVAVDARGPRFDGGIVTRIDAIPAGIVVNCRGERFADEGEDIWPKRYASWGRRIALEEDQLAFAIIDHRRRGAIMPPVFAPHEAPTIAGLAGAIGVDPARLEATVGAFNDHAPADAPVALTP